MNKAVDLPKQSVEVDEQENIGSNNSANRPFYDILRANMERRDVLKGSLATGATTFFAGGLMSQAVQAQSSLMNFNPVTVAEASAVDGTEPLVSSDYEMQTLIPWGDPIEPSGPAYVERGNSSREQALQVGIGHDGMWLFPLQEDLTPGNFDPEDNFRDAIGRYMRTNNRGMLCINHEFGRTSHVLGKDAPESLEETRIMQHAHGVSVIFIQRKGGEWRTVDSKNSRRIHVNTPVEFSGPAADSTLLQTPNANIPLGTVNNCGNATTPWGTYLTCEENFNGYFGATNNEETWVPTEAQERYGFSENGFGYAWHLYDRRFDLSDPDYRNEENRFGWMVEIDPQDATAKPVKHTAMGRFKHEGGAFRISDSTNQLAFYMGDDQRFDYIYKYVSSGNWETMMANGTNPLSEGTLYVARFNEDGTGDWLELSLNNPAVAAVFSSMDEVLVYARLAADAAGATPMDRPEWTTTAPDGNVYVSLTNNSRREVADAANPLAPNADGHIIRMLDADPIDTTFEWDIFIIAEDTHGTEESFADPDGLYADEDGRLFIETDGGQKDGLQNQVLVADTNTKEIRRLFSGVNGCEITGVAHTPNREWFFFNVQHPGNGDPTQTNFPAPADGVTIPRDATVVVRRKDRGVAGS